MANSNFGGGDGTELNPFIIEDIYDFSAIRNYANHNGKIAFKQMKDLDFSGVLDFAPISLPSADLIYDGNGKSIKNIEPTDGNTGCFVIEGFSSIEAKNITFSKLTLKSNFASSVFGYIYDTGNKNHKFENVKVLDSFFSGSNYATALFLTVNRSIGTGEIEFLDCMIKNCKINGDYISGLSSYSYSSKLIINKCCVLDTTFAAGVNGYSYISYFAQSHYKDGSPSIFLIENSYAKGNEIDMSGIQYQLYFGGLLNSYANYGGGTVSIKMSKCYLDNNLSLYSGADIYFGGFLGYGARRAIGSLSVTNCFLLGSVSASSIGYGEVGEIISSTGSDFGIAVNNVKKLNTFNLPPNKSWNSGLDNQITTTINEIQSNQKLTYKDGAAWDFDKIWDIKEGLDTPFFKQKRAVITCKRVPLNNYRR